jgi:FAD/FMN-containing dehydrogenase
VNYLADDDTARVQAAYWPCWDRLQQVKRTYDPENVFHLNQNVTPA